MNRKVKVTLALFLAFAVLVQYSFCPQALYAYGLSNTAAAQSEEQATDDSKDSDKQETTKETEETKATEVTEPSENAEEPEGDTDESDAKAEDKSESDADNPDSDKPAAEESQADDPEEDADKKEDVKYPAVKFSEKANGVQVNISAPEGALPEGTTVKVRAVSAKEIIDSVEELINEGKIIKAVDITFYDKDGKDIEPKKDVSVTFASKKFADLKKPAVIHIDDDGNAEKVKGAKVNTDNNKATFKTDEFSVYAVIDTVKPRLTVKFMNGSEEIAEMIIKAEDTEEEIEKIIYDPGAGIASAGQVFKGWTTDEEYTSDSEMSSIAQVRSDVKAQAASITSNQTVIYYAGVFKQYKITYVDGAGITVGTEVAETPNRETEANYTVNQGYTTDDTHNFEGWLVSDGLSNITDPSDATAETLFPNGTEIKVKGDVKFSVSAPEGHWLIFDENGRGATYNAPRFIKAGETTSDEGLLDMVRNGYNFGGWYKDAACTTGNEFEFGHTISETTTIYAKWTAKGTANYTVIIWKQNVAGDGYDFVESVPKSGNVNTTPTAVNATTGVVNGATYRGETGFSFKSTDQASKTIAPEGNTVVNVYWDRNEYTLTFKDGTGSVTFVRSNGNSQTNAIGNQITSNINDYERNKKYISGYEVSYRTGWGTTYAIKIDGS